MPQSLEYNPTLIDLLESRSERLGKRCLYTFLPDGENEKVELSYEELCRRAKAIASSLQARGFTNQRAVIIGLSGLDYIAAFFGCLYAGVTAVPVPPLDPANLNIGLLRLQALVKDAEAAVVLTTQALPPVSDAIFAATPDLGRLAWVAVKDLAQGSAGEWRRPEVHSHTLAFIQYTSGSTGKPKGVMLSHRNLLYNCGEIHRLAEHHAGSVCVSWLPIYHNMGLIGGILTPLTGGFPGVLMSPLSFLQRPMRWLDAISRFGGTTSPLPNFALDLCVKRFDPERYPDLDLSRWEVACCGSEPIRPSTLERFAETFAPYGFRKEALFPAYGLAEATLIVTGPMRLEGPKTGRFEEEPLKRHRAMDATSSEACHLVSCGKGLQDQALIIVHPETATRCEAGEVGEIWLAGPGVAQGYWNRPEETAATFSSFLSDTGEGPFLRTGDLGFLKDDDLYVTGRLKDVIIICGKNYYPQDIELTVEKSHPALRSGCSAAFSVEVEGEERLVIASEIERRYHDVAPALDRRSETPPPELEENPDLQKVIESIRMEVARYHGLPVHAVLLLKAESIPKTTGGKIQRHACKAGFFSSSLKVVATDSTGESLNGVTVRSVHARP